MEHEQSRHHKPHNVFRMAQEDTWTAKHEKRKNDHDKNTYALERQREEKRRTDALKSAAADSRAKSNDHNEYMRMVQEERIHQEFSNHHTKEDLNLMVAALNEHGDPFTARFNAVFALYQGLYLYAAGSKKLHIFRARFSDHTYNFQSETHATLQSVMREYEQTMQRIEHRQEETAASRALAQCNIPSMFKHISWVSDKCVITNKILAHLTDYMHTELHNLRNTVLPRMIAQDIGILKDTGELSTADLHYLTEHITKSRHKEYDTWLDIVSAAVLDIDLSLVKEEAYMHKYSIWETAEMLAKICLKMHNMNYVNQRHHIPTPAPQREP